MKGVILGLFTVLLAGSIYFYPERILFCDASFILFRILNYHTFQIQEHRYGSFITQAIPLMGSWMHLSLRSIVVAYSISFNLFYLSIALLLVYRFHTTGLAVLMAFYFVLFVSDTFFWTNNEIHQGIAWMFLWIGSVWYVLENNKNVRIMFPLFMITGFLAVFTHPLVAFPAVFLWLFFLVNHKTVRPRWILVVLSVILLITCFVKYKTSIHPSSYYDAEKLKVFREVKTADLLKAFASPMAREMYHRCLYHYWLVPVLFIIGMYCAIRQHKYMVALLTTGFCVVYFIAACLTFRDFIPFYTESEWMPFSIIATTPFVFFTLPQLKPRLAVVMVALILLIRLIYILPAAAKFTERKDYIFSVLNEMDRRQLTKAIVPENDHNRKILLMNWGVPTESIIASALRKDPVQKNFVVLPLTDTTSQIPSDPHVLMVPFGMMHSSELNGFYFEIDTGSRYKVLWE